MIVPYSILSILHIVIIYPSNITCVSISESLLVSEPLPIIETKTFKFHEQDPLEASRNKSYSTQVPGTRYAHFNPQHPNVQRIDEINLPRKAVPKDLSTFSNVSKRGVYRIRPSPTPRI